MVSSATTATAVIGAGGAFFTILSIILLKKLLNRDKIPSQWQQVGRVKDLFIYPLKSGHGTSSEALFVTDKGVKETNKKDNSIELRDRSFLIYTSKDNEVRTARQIPKTILIRIQAAKNGIILSAPNKIDLYISIPQVRNDVKVIFGNEPFTCTDCGESVAKWLSTLLLEKDEGLRLGYGDGSTARNVLRDHKKWAQFYTNMDNSMAGIFSDLAALHIVNEATIEDLSERLPEGQKVSVKNFRPNVLVEGLKAFEEDKWQYVKIGNVIAKVCLECLRCIETTVTENAVLNKEREPLRTLESYRKSNGPFKNGVMGIYLKVLTTGRVKKGDAICIPKA